MAEARQPDAFINDINRLFSRRDASRRILLEILRCDVFLVVSLERNCPALSFLSAAKNLAGQCSEESREKHLHSRMTERRMLAHDDTVGVRRDLSPPDAFLIEMYE